MTGGKTPFLIPSEVQHREFDAKLLLACIAAERGHPCIVGSRRQMHMRISAWPRGLYVAKDARASSLRMFRIMSDLGFRIVAWEEEGVVRHPDAYYYRQRISAGALRHVRRFLAWGEDDAQVIRRYPGGSPPPVEVTGNPRADLMRKELRPFFDDQVERIRKRFGRFLLVNSNFAMLNHYVPGLSARVASAEETPADEASEYRAGMLAHRSVLFEHFLAMVPELSRRFPDVAVVVRPHPSESHARWREMASRLSNVHVVYENGAQPWLMACACLVHNGCTTAVEAAILGQPALAYQPVRSERHDHHLPNRLSQSVGDVRELGDRVEQVLAAGAAAAEDPGRRALLSHHIGALEGSLASERIVDVLEDVDAEGPLLEPPDPDRVMGSWLHAQGRALVKRLAARMPANADTKNSPEYESHRFPGIKAYQVRERVRRFGQVLGRFEGVRVRKLARNVFRVSL